MNKKFLNIIKYLVFLIITFLLLWLAISGMDITRMFNQILEANVFWVIVSGMISVIAFIVRAQRWNLLIEPMGYKPGLKNTTYSVLVGYLANLAVPRLGEVSRCGALSRAESIPFNKLLGTVIVERIVDVISLLICILMTAVIEYQRLGNFFQEKIISPLKEKVQKLTSSPIALTVVIILALAVIIGVGLFLKNNNRKGSESKLNRIIKGFIDGLKSVGNLKRPGLFIFQSAFIWFLYYMGVYTALHAFTFTSELGAGAALFLLVAGGIGMSAPVQGGIGAYHIFVSQGLVLYGVSELNGLSFAFMLHGLQMVLVIVLGIVSLFLLFSLNKRNQGIEETKPGDFLSPQK